jgi:hypothetical protein
MRTRTIEVKEITPTNTIIIISSLAASIDFSCHSITLKVYFNSQLTPFKFVELRAKKTGQSNIYTLKLPKGTQAARLVFETRSDEVDLTLLTYEVSEKKRNRGSNLKVIEKN